MQHGALNWIVNYIWGLWELLLRVLLNGASS